MRGCARRCPIRTRQRFPQILPSPGCPQGHFYSPIPSADDRRRATRVRPLPREIAGVNLQEDAQLALLEKMLPLYASLGFTAEPDPAAATTTKTRFTAIPTPCTTR